MHDNTTLHKLYYRTGCLSFLVVSLSPTQESKLIEVLVKYQKMKLENTLLMVPFTTMFDYLFHLRELSILLEPLGSRAMVYLAAAVSDFYIHPSNMVIVVSA